MRSKVETKRASIDVELSVVEALALVEESFKRNKTSSTRTSDGGWTVEHADDAVVIYPKSSRDYLLEPLPADYTAMLPETLGVRIDAIALAEGGARVSARLVRRRVGSMVGTVVLDMLAIVGGGIPLASTMLHGKDMTSLRKNRRAAKLRLLQLALEPLILYELPAQLGPFRE